MLLSIGNLPKSTDQLLKLISDFNNIRGYKVYIEYLFLYSSDNEQI